MASVRLAVVAAAVGAGLLAGVTAVVNLVTLIARARLAALPDPGAGLPGLSDP